MNIIRARQQERIIKIKEITDTMVKAREQGKNIDEEKIKQILVERCDFSEERVENQLDKIRKKAKAKEQKGLGQWF